MGGVTSLSHVIQSIDEYFLVKVEISHLASHRSDQDAFKLVYLRRRLSRKLTDLQHAISQCVQNDRLDTTLIPELIEHNAMFSAERRSVADHQAKWNAPLMQRDRQGYEMDHKDLFRMNEARHHWRKRVLIPALEKAIRERQSRTITNAAG